MHLENFAKSRYKINAKNATELNNHFKSVIDKREGKPFHEWQQEDRKKNPEPYGWWNNECVKAGMLNASNYMKSVMDSTNKDHEKALKSYSTQFNSDRSAAEGYFIDKARELMGAKKLEIKNDSYENSLFKKMRFDTSEDYAFGHKLKMNLKTKHDAVGYDGDDEFIDAFIKDHPFSKDPRPELPSA